MQVALCSPQMNANELIDPASDRHTPPPGESMRARRRSEARPHRVQTRALVVRDPAELEGPAARVRDLAQAVARRIRSRPFASLMLAVGVGFVVGGALSFRLGRALLASASRHIARELLKQVL